MASSKSSTTVWHELLSAGLYKRNQGRRVRQVTAVSIALVVILGAYTLSQGPLAEQTQLIRVGLPGLIGLLGAWSGFRMVNYPPFADFLISVEAEMDKVAWPSREELYRATVVVLITMFVLGMTLLLFDLVWQAVFRAVGFLRI